MKILTEAVKLNKDFSGHCIQQDKFLKFEFIFYKNLWIFKHPSIKTQIFAISSILARYCNSESSILIPGLSGTNSNCFNWADMFNLCVNNLQNY